MQLTQTIVKFPEIKLKTRDAHKLRGFFGNMFRDYSTLLHNHFEDGTNRYAYPLVQYKVINNTPCLIGLLDGAKLLIELFLKIRHIDIDGTGYIVNSKNISTKTLEIGSFAKLSEYKFETLWIALNQKNHKLFLEIKNNDDKNDFLNRQLQNNILSFYKGIGFVAKERIMVTGKYIEKSTQLKNKQLLAFSGSFTTNATIPDLIGLGKLVSRGFGTVTKK
ncbi:MAG: CRISPR-associated endonuclease Cas6 [Chlorobi bacterium]|nr:CRISPR-associated endonuclease Cas6 [Chlorobiota bacterium]